MTRKFLLLCLIATFCTQPVRAQQHEKPKVALVLSGGGAKGIAHIPLLQALDSLGIVPDLVIGTSMGSIVGGLYSVGYSGDTIAAIAENADWSILLGGDISLRDVTVEEKSEFKRYLVDFDIVEGKPKVSSGLLNDQKLREFITSLVYPVYDVNDFDNLPIPYRAMTTDIVNGEELLLGEGSVALAMRASMSIPGIFQPVPYENTLLVDGGVLNNFPVDVAKQMGADIIIGSDVGGGMQKKEKLNSIPSLLFQAAMLNSNLKNPENRKMCTVLVDHMPHLTYSTGDFAKSHEIYEQGKVAVKESIDQLSELAGSLRKHAQREHKVPQMEYRLRLDTIIYNEFSPENLDLVKARMNIKPGQAYSSEEIIEAIDRSMGTNLFHQITYSGFKNDSLQGLVLNGFELSQHQVKGSLHYDSYRSAGILVNYTGRNVIGNASRVLVSLDIAIQPKFRVQYQKTFGKEMNYWWRTEVLGEALDQKFYFLGEVADNFESRYLEYFNEINKNFNSLNSYAGLDLTYRYSRLYPQINPDINNNILNLKEYKFKTLEFGAHYQYSSLNRNFFPVKGSFFRAFVARSLMQEVGVEYKEFAAEEKGSTNGFTRFGLDFEKRFPLGERATGILGLNLAFIATDDADEDELSFTDYGYSAQYSMGGVITAAKRLSYVFPGLHEDEIFVSQLMNLNLGLQYNLTPKIFVTPHVNLASVGYTEFSDYMQEAFSPSGSWSLGDEVSGIISAGAALGYNSFLGPLNLDFSWINDADELRVFFSIGLILNRSN